MSKLMKIIDERERQKHKDRKTQSSGVNYSKLWKLNGFVVRLS